MGFIADVNKYATEFLVILFVIAIILGIALWYFLKIKKVRAKEELINYDSFERRDSREYVKFDTIVSGGIDGKHHDMGMIVTNNGTRFVSILSVTGYNFSSASAEERGASMRGYLSFLNTVKEPIQYRQSTKAVDLSERIEVHKNLLKDVSLKILNLDADYKELLAISEQYLNQPDIYNAYATKLEKLQKDITTEAWLKSEIEIEIEYMESISGQGNDSSRVESYIIDWKYDPTVYTEEMTTEQIYVKAINELAAKASNLISALARCNCTARLLSAPEIVDIMRHHYSPLSADDTKIEDMLGTNYNSLFVTSDSLVEIEKERLGDVLWQKKLKQQEEARLAAQAQREQELDKYEEALMVQLDEETRDYDPEMDLEPEYGV